MDARFILVGLLTASSLTHFGTAPTFAQTASGEWTSLFDGRTLDSWGNTGKAEDWTVENGLLVCQSKRGGNLYTKHQYENYVLALDFKLDSPEANSGVWLRWCNLNDPVNTTIQVQICSKLTKAKSRNRQCGALLDLAEPFKDVEKPIGEWNHLVITCDGPAISVEMNGEKICEMNVDQYDTPRKNPHGTANPFPFTLKNSPRKGYIGLESYVPKVWFKDIKIKALRAAAIGAVPSGAGTARTTPTLPLVAPSLPPEQKVQAVMGQLKQLNPAFDGREQHKVEAGAVTELAFSTVGVTDITPLKALAGLKRLSLAPWVANQKGALQDLSPLQGLPLTALWCHNTAVVDLTPLKGMPLAVLNCSGTQIKSLAPLAGMKLQVLSINDTPVNDLSPIAGMALTVLWCNNTKVADLSPLKIMPLQELKCDFLPARDATILRGIKTLTKINDTQAAMFWMRAGVDGGVLRPSAGGSQVDLEPLYRVDFSQEGSATNSFIVQGKIPTLGFVRDWKVDVPKRMLVCRGEGAAYIPCSTRSTESVKKSFTVEVVFRMADIENPPKSQVLTTWGNIRIVVEHSKRYSIVAYTPTYFGGLPSFEAGQWHTVRLILDTERKKRALLLDGNPVRTDREEKLLFSNDFVKGSRIYLAGARPSFQNERDDKGLFVGDIRSFTLWDRALPHK